MAAIILTLLAAFLLERVQVRYLLDPFGARSGRAHRVLLYNSRIPRVQLLLLLAL